MKTFLYPELVDSQINDEDILLSSGNTTDSRNNNLTAFRQMSESDWAYMDQIIVSVTEPDMNRVEKIKAIHDWMVNNIKYDTNMKQHNASDTLNNGVAVCSGYAALFANFMDTLGIPNQYVYGTAHNSQGNREGHAWNLIELEDGKYYLVDVTWDDPLFYNTSDYKDGSNMNYDYFLVAVRNVTNHTSSIEMASPLATENFNWQSFMGKRVIIDPDPEPTPEPTPKPEPQSEPIPAPEPMPEPTPEPEPKDDPVPPCYSKDEMKGSIVEPNDDPTSHGVETVIVYGENGDFKVIPKSEYDETKDYFEKDPELNYYFEMPEDLDYCTSNEESEMTVFEGKEIDTIMVAPYELDDDGVVNGYFDFSDI